MSSVNHTPGPWSVGIADWTDAGNARYELRGIKTVSAPDARLIASAPDLLAERDRLKAANAELVAACEASNQCITDLTEVYTNQSSLLILDEAVKSLRDDALKLVRAALAKNQKETV